MKFTRSFTWSFTWAVVAVAGFSFIAADPALARAKRYKAKPQCVERPAEFSWRFLLPGSRVPQPNGCAPPAYAYGQYVGQDPDRFIRLQLKRDPASGYSGATAR
jgi:hypothetical protein